jgi:hypothetical protein
VVSHPEGIEANDLRSRRNIPVLLKWNSTLHFGKLHTDEKGPPHFAKVYRQ